MSPSAPTASGDLAALRAEIDRIDDSLHDLLMQRAELVAEIGASADKAGTQVALRPGREAAIIRRLLARHAGPLPPAALVRLWRELLAATTSMQRPFVVAVCDTDPGRELIQASREQFGALTPLRMYGTPADALRDLSEGAASVAVLPFPVQDEPSSAAWWTALLDGAAPGVFVVARLPFWAPRAEGAPTAPALVLAAIAPDPSGQDRSLLGFTLERERSRALLSESIRSAGLAPLMLILRHGPGEPARALVEVEGFLTNEDPCLSRLGALAPVVLGAYATPLDGPSP
jgi:chorismate mutase/prephenate dehydratase